MRKIRMDGRPGLEEVVNHMAADEKRPVVKWSCWNQMADSLARGDMLTCGLLGKQSAHSV